MKIRNNFVSNSSSCSFIICKKLLEKKQIEKIRNWYKKISKTVYVDDLGICFDETELYISGTIGYVKDEIFSFCEDNDININNIYLMES